MGTCNKKDGAGAVELRNSTTLVMHMKIYDESVQQHGEAFGLHWIRMGREHCFMQRWYMLYEVVWAVPRFKVVQPLGQEAESPSQDA